ncbi:MAG: LacI family DNA-binding transcriptional regulator [Planctomycetota bacterium]
MVTLKEVAKAAGVHYSTASSVLNAARGNTRVSPKTCERVRDAAKRLGYTPNQTAQVLRTRRTRTIGFVAGDLRNPFFAELAVALESELRDAGYRLLLASHADLPLDDAVDRLLGPGVDSLLAWSEGDAAGGLSHPTHNPCILTAGSDAQWRHRVEIDLEPGLIEAVAHLRATGVQRLIYYAPDAERDRSAVARRVELLTRLTLPTGIDLELLRYTGGAWDLLSAKRGAETHDSGDSAHTVTLGFNDVAAMGWRMTHSDGQVVGHDGTRAFRAMAQNQPAIDLQIEAVASAAARLAVALAEQEAGTEQEPAGVRIASRWRLGG